KKGTRMTAIPRVRLVAASFLLTAILIAPAGCRRKYWSDESRGNDSSRSTSDSVDGQALEFTGHQFSVDLTKERVLDPEGAARKYAGRRVKLRDKVAGYGYTLKGEPALHLEDGGAADFVCKEASPASKALPGQTV